MTPLTVACLFVRGEYPYTVEYVQRLHEGVRRHLARPFRFVCITDRPEDMPPDVETIVVDRIPDCFAFWSKLHLFNPALGWTGRMLYLDLDTLVVGSLDPIVDAPFSFTCAEDVFGHGQAAPVHGVQRGRMVRAKHQGSVIVWDAGAVSDLWTAWTPAVADAFYGCDDWLSERYPDAPVLPIAWFPRISQVQPPWTPEAKVILVKKPKNHIAADRWPWFNAIWRAA